MFFEAPELPGQAGSSSKPSADSIQVEIDKANKGSKLEEINAAARRLMPPREKWRRLDAGIPPRGDRSRQRETTMTS